MAKLKQYYYFHAEFLEEVRYSISKVMHGNHITGFFILIWSMDKIFKAEGRLGDYYAQSMWKFSYSIVSRALISAGLLLDLSYAMIYMIIVTCNDEAVCIHTVKPCITLLGQVHLYSIFFLIYMLY